MKKSSIKWLTYKLSPKRFLRLLDCFHQFLRFLWMRPFCALLRKFSAQYSELWLIGERGTDARDNAYWLYRYLHDEHPEVNAWYVISKDSKDREKFNADDKLVEFKSFRHYLMYYSAEYLAGTHVSPAAPNPIMYFHMEKVGIHPHGKRAFLQHGITKDNMTYLKYPKLKVDLFVAGAKREFEYIRDTFNHPEGVVQYLGFCRFDKLLNVKTDNMILLMPTWRGSWYADGIDFTTTQWYKAFQSLLNNQRLIDMLENNDFKLIFYPHSEMQKYLSCFSVKSDRIILASEGEYDVQDLLKRCRVLVTDYSSVYFDVAYMTKPVLYYQFDEEEYRSYHYKEGYFVYRRDGFGPVCTEESELVNELEVCFDNDLQMSDEYLSRAKGFFELMDSNNCKRTYQAILNTRKK